MSTEHTLKPSEYSLERLETHEIMPTAPVTLSGLHREIDGERDVDDVHLTGVFAVIEPFLAYDDSNLIGDSDKPAKILGPRIYARNVSRMRGDEQLDFYHAYAVNMSGFDPENPGEEAPSEKAMNDYHQHRAFISSPVPRVVLTSEELLRDHELVTSGSSILVGGDSPVVTYPYCHGVPSEGGAELELDFAIDQVPEMIREPDEKGMIQIPLGAIALVGGELHIVSYVRHDMLGALPKFPRFNVQTSADDITKPEGSHRVDLQKYLQSTDENRDDSIQTDDTSETQDENNEQKPEQQEPIRKVQTKAGSAVFHASRSRYTR